MKLSFFPRYDRTAASTRLRVYAIAEEIQRQCLATVAFNTLDADVLVVQKAVDASVFERIRDHKRVIYDYDDVMPTSTWRQITRMGITPTTDTEIHRQMCPFRAHVWPDPIDYCPSAPMECAPASKLAWFGNWPCYDSARSLFEYANGIPRVCITDRDKQVSKTALHLPWTLETFPDVLRSCGTAFLSHARADQGKSENKLVAAVTLGVPVIVGKGSPSYEALLRGCDLDYYIVRDPDELREAWYELQQPEVRQAYMRRIQAHVWGTYRAEVVVRKFMQIVEGAA